MTVSNQNNRTSAVGSGLTGQEVPFSFPLKATSDLLVKKRVTITGVETILNETTNYTISLVADDGGTLTTVTTIETTEQIHLIGNMPKTQLLDLEQGGSFNAENIEDALDKDTKLAIQNSDAIGRCLQLNDTDPNTAALVLPNSVDRASKYIAFDSDGNITVATAVDDSTITVSAFMETVNDAADAAAARTTLGAIDMANVLDGASPADPTGATDSAAAIQAFLDANSNVHMPEGNYLINTALTFNAGNRLFGTGKSSEGTIITLGADVAAFKVTNVNDVEVFDILVIVNAAQTEPIIQLLATTVTITRNNFRGIQISGSAQTFTGIRLKTTTGAYGIWNCIFDDISMGGVGTVIELNTSYAGSWINSNRFTNFYVNDFVKGIELVNSAGDGSSFNVFRDWGAQCSARTTYGLLIPNSTEGKNRDNALLGVTWYDMQAGGKYYSIGTNVIGTVVRWPRGDSDTVKITDNGTRSNIDSKVRYFYGQLWLKADIIFDISGNAIAGPAADDSYYKFTARYNGVGGVEVARCQGAADPYFKSGDAVFRYSGNGGIGTLDPSVKWDVIGKTRATAFNLVCNENQTVCNDNQTVTN